MKLKSQYTKRKKGMTLLELTVVILVLLALIAILFVGARAWKRGADRSANILNIRNIQQAVRGHANMFNLDFGDTLASTEIVSSDGSTGYMKEPEAPGTLSAYTYTGDVPVIGSLYSPNNADDAVYGFTSSAEYQDW
ncbi:MAG: prepilin-type N-terminal cleavage/methylation domain-containing protein [Akkermansiaceae bacterium]|nr:prepilin-type N-terminal cleavage/methylation domain-containing protein [Akkermansiaceae bacterium]